MHHIEKFSFRFVALEDVRLIIKDLKNNTWRGYSPEVIERM